MRKMLIVVAIAGVALGAAAMADETRTLMKVRPPTVATQKAVKRTIYDKLDVSALTPEQQKKLDAVRAVTDKKIAALLAEEQNAILAIEGAKEKTKDELDSMSELGEMESLRLQMVMDRRSKAMEALSNIMKKQSETSKTIIQNMK